MLYKRQVAIFILYTKDRKILLQKRDTKAPTLPGYWSFFGGGIEEGESPLEAVEREAQEELSLHNMNFERIGNFDVTQDGGVHRKYVFVAPLTYTLESLRKNQHEGEDLGLFNLNEIRNIKFPEFNYVIIEGLRDFFNNDK